MKKFLSITISLFCFVILSMFAVSSYAEDNVDFKTPLMPTITVDNQKLLPVAEKNFSLKCDYQDNIITAYVDSKNTNDILTCYLFDGEFDTDINFELSAIKQPTYMIKASSSRRTACGRT